MKKIITSFSVLLLGLLGWYFLLPQTWLEPIVEAPVADEKPEVLIPPDLFTPGPDVMDANGELLSTNRIGGLVWTAANARVTTCGAGTAGMRFANGAEKGPSVAFYDKLPRYGYYQNDPSKNFGVLYNHAAVRECNLCPEGFRIATKADWSTLFASLGTAADRGKFLMRRYGSPFATKMGGRVDSYGSVLGGSFVFYWAADQAPALGGSQMAWGPEIRRNGEVQIRQQNVQTACYVRCVRDAEK